jgi:CheY-like chemotaxis protein
VRGGALDADLDALRTARTRRVEATARHVASVTSLSTSLSRWAREHALRRVIVVVDDDAAAGATIAHALRAVAPVVLVGDYDAARRVIERERPAVIVADHLLSDASGRTGALLLSLSPRGPRAVLLSGLSETDALRAAARAVHALAVERPTTLDALDAFTDLVRGLVADATGT